MAMPVPQSMMSAQIERRYREEMLAGLTPVELLVKVYDVAIAACERQDRARLSQALVELVGALNFDHREIAVGLFRLYNYCLRETKAGHFDAVKPILVELRDTWQQAARTMKVKEMKAMPAHV